MNGPTSPAPNYRLPRKMSYLRHVPTGSRLLVVHFLATAALAGLIWTIQIVQYPLLAEVGKENFARYHAGHSSRITYIVGPLMGLELLCALWIAIRTPKGISPVLAIASLVILFVVHATTTFASVPAHNILGNGFNTAAHHRLVATNWIRTAGWTLRALLAAQMVLLVWQSSLKA
jgi:hypothetical protein